MSENGRLYSTKRQIDKVLPRPMNFRIIAALTALLFALAPDAVVSAQDMEPRAYSNAPVGMNFLIAGYGFAEGGVAFDPSVPLTNAHVRANGAFLAYARAFGI